MSKLEDKIKKLPFVSSRDQSHEYCLTKEMDDKQLSIFEEVKNKIELEGYYKYFYRRKYKYFDIGGYHYWICGEIKGDGYVLNRGIT